MRLSRAFTVLTCGTLLCLPAMCTQLVAAAPPPEALTLENGRNLYPIRKAQVIIDKDKVLSLEEIRRLEALGKAPWATVEKLNFGYSKARYWLKVEITNISSIEQNWILEFSYPLIQILHVYRFDDAKDSVSWLTGRLAPFSSRPIAHRNFLFNFSSAKGGRTVFYLMLESSGTLLAPMTVYSQREFLGRSVGSTAGIGLYCGVILAMVLFNFFLLLTSRDRNYLYYICYAFTFCLLMNTLNGMAYQYLWPNMVAWNRVSVPILAGVCYLFLVLFTRSFLETKRYAPRLERGLTIILAGALFLIFGGLLHYGLLVNKFTSFFISAAPLVVLPISLWCLRKGSKVAGYYSLAFSFFFIGAALRAARDLAWIPQSLFTDYGAYFGSAAEMLLLSLGLAARIRLLKDEKLRSELQAFEAERQLTDSRSELERQSAISSMAAQVAHDIRSPLVALDAALKHTEQLPEKQRVMVRHAVNRIRDIANNLLEKNRWQPGVTSTSNSGRQSAGEPMAARLLSSLIDPVITEKRLQFESKPGVSINFDLTRKAYGLFASIQPVEFGRMISNLVNNAVEAVGDKGAVDVRLSSEDRTILLTMTDDGKGIPSEILVKLGRKGETHGKAEGSGLGLFHARSTAESWGGSLTIASTPGKGTAVTLKLPQAQTPAGFVAALELTPGRPVVVFDDDPGIHQVWQGRFESSRLKDHNIDVIHFSEPAGLRAWAKAEPAKAKTAVCLFDYEFSGFKETGLSLAEELGLCAQTILVSSRCEEKRIIEDCARLKVRRIPKGLSDFVPITIAASAAPVFAVLLDNDALTHMNWEDAAQEHGVDLKAFTDPAEFFARLGEFPKDIPLYIDSDLGDNIKGENIAADLKEKGFTNIYLTTGHPPERFAHFPWLRVVTKEAPWSGKTEE